MTRNIHPTGILNVLKREMTDKKIQKTVLYLRCQSTGICYVLIHKLGTLSISMQLHQHVIKYQPIILTSNGQLLDLSRWC